MQKSYAGRFGIDNRTGRVLGAEVELQGLELVFTPSTDPSRPVLSTDVEPPEADAFERFAALGVEAKREVKGDMDCYQEVLNGKILDFARGHGPLFGLNGATDLSTPIIREPLRDWLNAQRVMSRALHVVAYAEGEDCGKADFDDYFYVISCDGPEMLTWNYVFDSDVVASKLYATCLKEDICQEFSTDDGSELFFIWGSAGVPEGAPFSSGRKTMIAIACQHYPQSHFPRRFRSSIPRTELMSLSEMTEPTLRKEAGALLKIVADRHTGGMSLGYRNFWNDCETPDEGSYGIVCSCYLSYMWHELAQRYTRNQFRICKNPKCGVIISTNVDSRVQKEYCSDGCRAQANNLKMTDQQRRARKAFYDVKPYREIYEAAFGKPYTGRDPERGTLEKRLDKWIEGYFLQTKKGKSAYKQGSGSKE